MRDFATELIYALGQSETVRLKGVKDRDNSDAL